MIADAPPVHEYHYIEHAIGGTSHRNNVGPEDQFRHHRKAKDVYTSVFRFREEFAEYTRTNLRQAKRDGVPLFDREGAPVMRPSVASYPGPCLPLCVHFDLDHEDRTVALRQARQLTSRLVYDYGIDPRALAIYPTGSKGFDVRVPAALFDGFEASPTAHRLIRRLAENLIAGLEIDTFDPSVYDKTRLMRVPNTIHSKTGRYKVPITFDELHTLTLEQIDALAVAPRHLERLPDDEWMPIPELVALKEAADQPEEEVTPHTPPTARGAADEGAQAIAVEILTAAWPGPGDRHRAALALCGGLQLAGWSKADSGAFVAQVAVAAMGAEGTERADEWQRGAETTAARIGAGEQVNGWPTLADIIGDARVAAVRAVLGLTSRGPTVILEDGTPAAACTDCERLRERVAAVEAREQRRRQRHLELVRYKRAVRRVIRDPGLDDGQKMTALLFSDLSEQWARKPAPGGKIRLFMAKTAEAYGMPKSTLRARRESAERMGALAVEEQTVYHPVIDDRTGQPKIDPRTHRVKTWPETIITVTPKAFGTDLLEGIASRKLAPSVPRVKEKKKPRGRWCSNKCVADIVRETVTTWRCGGCGEVIDERRSSTAPGSTPPTNFAPPTPAENVANIYGSRETKSAPPTPRYTGSTPRQTLPPLWDDDANPFDRPAPPAIVAAARGGRGSPLEQQPGQPTFRVVAS